MNRLIWLVFLLSSVHAQFNESVPSQRYQTLTHQLKCVQCNGSSIAESDAIIAKNMRKFVRTRIEQGDSDKQIIDFLTERYGEQINTRPKASGATLWLWLLPPLALLLGFWIVYSSSNINGEKKDGK